MEPPSPARLYATLAGAVLFVAGLLGFFEDLSWLNFLHIGTGTVALLLADRAARLCALLLGIGYAAPAIFAFGSDGWLHLGLGLLGIAAFAAASSEPRAQAAGKSP